MNYKGKQILFIVLFFVTVMACKTEKIQSPAIITAENMDLTVKPGNDFYQYANGGWMQKHPLPDDYGSYGTFHILYEENQELVKSIIEEAAKVGGEKGSVNQQVGDFYASGMDTVAIEAAGITPLKPYIEKIEAISSLDDLQNCIGYLHAYSVACGFSLSGGADRKNSTMTIAYISQDGLGLPDRDYYFNQDPNSVEMREAYLIHLAKMFVLMGDDDEKAKKQAQIVMDFETRLAAASMTMQQQRDPHATYNKFDFAGLQAQCEKWNWVNYFKNMDISAPQEINVSQLDFLNEFYKMLTDVEIENWKAYLRWCLINEAANYLSSDFVNQNFDFYGKTLSGIEAMRPRWKRVLGITDGSLGEAVGKIFVDKYFPPAAKTRMEELVKNLKLALADRINNVDWMADETKAKALDKLQAVGVKVGYPNKWRDYSALEISKDSYLANVLNASKFNKKYRLDKIGKPVDKEEWHMTPQTVNAYYSPTGNEIVFPAGILQPPFFYLEADDAINYGAIGVVIGHEITHGFDDKGRQYDKEGNLNEWWTAEDAENFNNRAKVLIEQFNNITVLDTLKANGALTIGENIADLGGLNIAYTAYLKSLEGKDEPTDLEGFTHLQRFFLSYSHVWAQNIRDKDIIRKTTEDVHSLGKWRVNGPLPNMPEFYAAFNIDETAALFIEESKRAKIW